MSCWSDSSLTFFSGSVGVVEVSIVILGYPGLAAWIAVLAADSERRPYAIIARRRRRFAVLGKLSPSTHHDGQCNIGR